MRGIFTNLDALITNEDYSYKAWINARKTIDKEFALNLGINNIMEIFKTNRVRVIDGLWYDDKTYDLIKINEVKIK